MNKVFLKKSLTFLLTLLMLLSAIPAASFTVFAAGEAMVGGVSYSTLAEAIAAAPNGSKVYITSNVEVSSTVNIAKTVTLTTNGGSYTIKRSSGFTGEIFNVSGTLMLSPSSGSFTVSGSSNAKDVLVNVSGGTFTMNDNCLLTGNTNSSTGGSAVHIASGVFNFAGGEIKGNSCSGYGNAVYVANDFGTLRMSGSASIGSGSNIYLKSSTYIELPSKLAASSAVNVYVDNAYEGRKIAAVTGGFTLSQAQISRFQVHDGSELCNTVYSDSAIFISFAQNPDIKDVCKIGNKIYDTLAQAVAACPADKSTEIIILSSFSLDSEIKITNGKKITLKAENSAVISRAAGLGSKSMFSVDSDSSLALSGALQISGSSLSSANAVSLEGSLTMGNSVAFTNHKCENGVISVTGGSFTMNGGMLSANTVSNGTVFINKGSFNMKGGEIKLNTAVNGGGVYLANGSFTMSNGSIYGNTAAVGNCIWAGADFSLSGNASLGSNDVSAMVYLGTDAKINAASDWVPAVIEGYGIQISLELKNLKLNAIAATFEGEVKADRFTLLPEAAAQYALKANGKNVIVVSADDAYVAFYENKGYTTLEDAFAQIPDEATATVNVVGDALVAQTITVKKGQTISLIAADALDSNPENTQRNIRRATDFTAPFFVIEEESSLTLSAPEGKKLYFDGESKEVQGSAFIVNGTLSIGEGAYIVNNNNKIGELITAQPVYTYGGAVSVAKKGVCTLSGGTIDNCYASLGGAVYVKDGAFNISLGYVINNKAVNGGGIYLENSTLFEKQTPEKEDGLIFASFTMAEGELKGNEATATKGVKNTGLGGGIFAGNGTKSLISGGVVSGNKASAGGAAYVGNQPVKADDEVDTPEFALTQKAIIGEEKGNTVHLEYPGISYVTVYEGLTEQKKSIVLSIPESMPQHMPLVKYAPEKTEEDTKKDKDKDEEEKTISAKPAIEKKLFELEENAAKKYVLSLSELDESFIINTTEEGVFAGYKNGRHYNGITRYKNTSSEEEDTEKEEAKEEEKEKKENISYKPITIGKNGIFSVYYEMNYYLEPYKSIKPMLTAAFPKGTRITVIDTTNEEQAAYYYYTVTGEETVAEKGTVTETLNEEGKLLTTLDIYEIPLSDFLKMGTDSEHYNLEYSAEAKAITEKMTFVVDFTEAEYDELRTPDGEHVMVWNHYVVDSKSGLTYDISAYVGHAKYTVKEEKESEIILTSEKDEIKISYSLSAESSVLCEKYGVVVLSLGSRFPKGTVFYDENGNQHLAAERSTLLTIPMARDSKGNIVKNGDITLMVINYLGTEIPESSLRAYIYASNNGKQYSDYADYDAKSEAINFSLAPKDKNGIIVTNGKGEKPFYNGYEELAEAGSIDVNVKTVTNGENAPKFRLFLQKKQKDGSYKNCELAELFVISDTTVKMVELDSGDISLALRSDLDTLKGAEFKIGFKNNDAVEYVKVNITN